jgi:hypothetical protein
MLLGRISMCRHSFAPHSCKRYVNTRRLSLWQVMQVRLTGRVPYHFTTALLITIILCFTSLSAHPRVPGDGEQEGKLKFFTAPLNVLHCTCRNLPRVTVGVSEWEIESERLGASQWRQWDVKHVYTIDIMHQMQHSIIWSTLSHAQTILLHA